MLRESGRNSSKICMGSSEFFVELTQEKVDNPLDFLKVLKEAFERRGNDVSKFNVSHLYGLNSMHLSHCFSGFCAFLIYYDDNVSCKLHFAEGWITVLFFLKEFKISS